MILIDPDAHPVIAHRGASAYAPENTLAAFTRAVTLGADAIEFDVRASADGVPVVIHDPTLDRTTDMRGAVHAFTLAQLQDANAAWLFPALPREPIPTLDAVLSALPDLPMLIEVKEVQVQAAVAELVMRHGAAHRCLIASENHAALAVFRAPPFLVGASRRDIARLYFGSLLGWSPHSLAYRGLSVPAQYRGLPIPTRRFVRAARRAGCPVHVWTVDDPAAAQRLRAAGVAGIVTNRPDIMHQNQSSHGSVT